MHSTDTTVSARPRLPQTSLRHALGPGFQLHAATDAALHLAAAPARAKGWFASA